MTMCRGTFVEVGRSRAPACRLIADLQICNLLFYLQPPSMSVHRNSADAQNAAELQDMVPTAVCDLSGPNAPLLAPADASSDHGTNGNIVTSELSYAGGWFIWILTFSAGISGLLFGYEYASILGPVYVSSESQ